MRVKNKERVRSTVFHCQESSSSVDWFSSNHPSNIFLQNFPLNNGSNYHGRRHGISMNLMSNYININK